MTQEKKNYTLPIVVMFFLFAMISFVTGFQNPFGVILKAQFEMSNLESQLGNAANFIAYAFMGVPAGMILQKKGFKFSSIAAMLVGLVGVALMFLSSTMEEKTQIISIYLCGAFVAGFSMCMLNTLVNPMPNTLGGGGKTGNQLLQFGGAFNSLGATICPVLVGYLMGDNLKALNLIDARPALWIAMAIFAFGIIVLAFSKLPEPFLEEVRTNKRVNVKDGANIAGALKFRHFTLGIVAIFCYVGVEVGIPSIANLFMTNQIHMTPAAAGSLVGTYWLLMLFGRLIGGSLGAKFSGRAQLTFVATIAIIFILIGIILPTDIKVEIPGYNNMSFTMIEAPINVLFFVLCGLCTSVMWGGIYNLAAEGLGKYTAVASGVFMVMVCGGGIIPLIQSSIADVCGYLPSYFVLVAAMAYILFYALVGSRVKSVYKEI